MKVIKLFVCCVSALQLVKYYLPHCKYCQLLDAEFEPLRDLFPQLEIVHINGAEVDTDVKRFPTVKLLDESVELVYKGPRTTQSLVEFVCNYTGDPVPEPVHFFDEATDSLLVQDAIVVFSVPWFEGWGNPYTLYYDELAKLYSEVKFVYVDASVSTQLVSQFKVSHFPSLFYVQSGVVYRVEGSVTRELVVMLVEGKAQLQKVDFSTEEEIIFSTEDDLQDDDEDEEDFLFYRDL